MKRRILVTGANGFVGRHIVSELAQGDTELVLVVRSGSVVESSLNVRDVRILETADLFTEDEHWWVAATTGVDTFVHAAWYTNPRDYMNSEQNQHCKRGTIKIAEALRNSGLRRFVGLGTCLEYHQTGEILTTETEIRPESPYARAKATTYLELSRLFHEANIEFAWCRLFYIHGPGEHESRLVPYLRREFANGRVARLANPNQVLDFLDVREVAKKVVQVVLGSESGALNVCSGVGTSVADLSLRVAEEYGRSDLVDYTGVGTVSVGLPIIGRPSL